MMSKNVSRRLERLAAWETPNSPRVLKILVTRIGGPDQTIELVLDERDDLRRGFWRGEGESDR